MRSQGTATSIRRAVAAVCALLVALPAGFSQAPVDPPPGSPGTQQATPLLSSDQLNNLVAPVALYPDPLLSQVLAASTYPLEVVEAQQWIGRNRNLQKAQLMDAARRQDWDPSVQALVAFPEALRLLANDVRWTADLGNAFLAQQADVMDAVQRMRAQARSNGRLSTTPQQVVTMDAQDGPNVIQILPADPQVIYVPIYSPAYVWGPPVWGAYPDLWYPAGFGFGFGFGPGIYMSAFFPSWSGWSGWGWGCGWSGRSLFLNGGFFSRYGFRGGDFGRYGGYYGGYSSRGFGGRAAWTHDPGHRLGTPYANRAVASRFNSARLASSRFSGNRMSGGQYGGSARAGSSRGNGARSDSGFSGNSRAVSGGRSAAAGEWRRFGEGSRSSSAGRSDARGFARSGGSEFRSGNSGSAGSYRQPSANAAPGGGSRSYRAPEQSSRGYSSMQGSRSAPSTGRSYAPSYSGARGDRSPAVSDSRSFSGSRGFGGGGSSAPRSYAAPAAPSRSFSAPRSSSSSGPGSSSRGSGFSGGRSAGSSGSSGGRSGGGGGHRR